MHLTQDKFGASLQRRHRAQRIHSIRTEFFSQLGMRILGVIAGILLVVSPVDVLAAEDVRGYASVKSGNKIQIGKQIFRLFGIRAPDTDAICQIGPVKMQCGIVAWSQLVQLADGWHLSCDIELKVKGEGDYATCYSGERDINESMVRSGWAKAIRRQTKRYVVDEEDAQSSKRGLWAKSSSNR